MVAEAQAGPVAQAQRPELRDRLVHHRAHPNEPGVALQALKTKLLGAAA